MSTVIRSEISKKNKYYLSKHRNLELRHFCLQYPEWEKGYKCALLSGESKMSGFERVQVSELSDPTFEAARMASWYSVRMKLVKGIAESVDKEIGKYVFIGVTRGYSFSYMKTKLNIPCSKKMYFDRYRKFFYLLDKER